MKNLDFPCQPEPRDVLALFYNVTSKGAVAALFDRVDVLASLFRDFRKYGEEFYDHVELERHKAQGQQADEEEEIDEIVHAHIRSNVNRLYVTIPAFILYMRRQEAEYVEFIWKVRIAEALQKLQTVTDVDSKTLHAIYEAKESDLINDMYLTLRYVRFVFENFYHFVGSDCDVLAALKGNESYSLVSQGRQFDLFSFVNPDEIRDHIENMRRNVEEQLDQFRAEFVKTDKIVWLRTSVELAYLFEQLAYRGYIENPQSKDGEMNKSALARVAAHRTE